jgi:hypothetical protein
MEFLARDIQFNEGCLYSELLGTSAASPSTISFEIPENPTPPQLPPVKLPSSQHIEDDADQQLQGELATSQQFSETVIPLPPHQPEHTPSTIPSTQ